MVREADGVGEGADAVAVPVTIDQVLRLEKLEREVEVLKKALVDQARMLHQAQDQLRRMKDAEPPNVVDASR